jgi:hypothetical protein
MKFACVIALVLVFSLVACSVDEVLADIDLALQMAAEIATAVGPLSGVDGAILQSLVNTAQQGLQAIETAYNDWEEDRTNTTKIAAVQAAVTALDQNLSALLSASHISNPNAVAKVDAWVNLITTATNAVLAAIPQVTNGPSAPMFEKVKASTSPKALVARWKAEVCRGDAKCGELIKVRKPNAKSPKGGTAGPGAPQPSR